MRDFQQEHETIEAPRAPERKPEEPSGQELHAAGAGRMDALGPAAALRLQQHVGNSAVGHSVQRSKVHSVVGRSSGQPLPASVVQTVERTYGPLPEGARMHTDSAALESAREVGAYAYASGRDIVIPADAPREIQLEEAYHLAQQRVHGDVAGNDVGNGVAVSDDNDAYEREAQGLARRHAHAPEAAAQSEAAAQPVAGGAGAAADAGDGSLMAVQRSTGPDGAAETTEEEPEEEPEAA